MKKLIIPLLAIAVLASCSKRETPEETIPGESPGGKVSIVLNSDVLLTKAPIVDGMSFTANVAGWESTGAVDYTASSNWLSTTPVTASETAGNVTLTPVQYYNPQTAKTYMKAWYPARAVADGQITGGRVTFAGADFTNDGTTDVLLAAQIVGDKTDAANKKLEFKHLLSQVSFKVVADVSMITSPTLKAIAIHNAELPTGIDLTTDALICAAPASLPVTGITDGAITIDATAKAAGSPAMFKPFAGNTFVISVETSAHTYVDATVTIKDDAAFVPGKAYEITITFKAKNEIALSATVTPWKTGSGSATVE